MSHLDQDDRDFDAYLQNDHALSDLYRELPQEHPSAELDRRVLEHVGETKTGSRLRRWTPISVLPPLPCWRSDWRG